MEKNAIFYLIAFLSLLLSYLFFNNAYVKMIRYTDLSNKAFSDHSHFQNLSHQINNAAVINPSLITNAKNIEGTQLFYTDSLTVIQQLNLLHSATADSINNKIIAALDKNIRAELPWLLNSNVPDSIVNHKAPSHIASLQLIDSLLNQGMKSTNLLLNFQEEKLNKEIGTMRIQMLIFIVLAGCLLSYTLINFSKIKTKNEKKFRALVEHGEDVILLTTREGKVLYVSSGIEKLTGFTLSDLIGKNIIMIMHPDYRNHAKAVFEELLKTPGISIPGHNRLLNKNGNHVDVEGTVTNLLDDENVRGIVTNFRDITMRKLEQDKLASSESRFRSLIESSNDIILMLDNSFKVIYRGPSAERVTGFTDEDIIGKYGIDFIHPDDRPFATKVFAEILSYPGVPVQFGCRNLIKNGQYIWVKGFATNFLQNENIKALVFNFRDITEQKEAKEQLIKSEEHFRMLFDQSPDGIFITDTAGNYINVNLSGCKMLGYTISELIGKNIGDTIVQHEEFKLSEQISRIANGIVSSEWIFLRKDGSVFIGEIIGSVLPNGHLQGILRDITERREVEEKLIKSEQIYRTIASSIPGSVICLFDTDLNYLLIEGDILEKLGYSKELLIGKSIKQVLKPENYEIVKKQFDQVKQGEIVTRESVSNGYDIISRFIPLKDENSKVYAIMTVTLDITEIKNAQRQIVEFNEILERKVIERTKQMEAVNKELQQFAYIASHDLQQPLRTVSNYMQVFEEDYLAQLDETAHRYLLSVNNATKRMSNLINSLLEFSKLSHSKKLTYVDCNELISDVIEDLDLIIKDSNAVIEVGKMPQLYLYEIEVHQLFQNLILNAIKFQFNGNQPEIKISSTIINNKWMFCVSDNGIGIDPAYFDRIFNIFQRLDSNNKYEGSGIGLANCKKIVQLHHGDIWVESIQGKGSTFSFTIPNLTV
ncbi:hypothetical protein BH10BAC3_BH10BAC3_32030 [soil metagenome]